ncbi:hypothetical protein D1007_45493 [Hordeum vulgare]|nr:hypothetical protein D1007_45493 [Hordeum vulgare]
MWSAGPERARCVSSDTARKRAARKYTNRGLERPPLLLRRETEEYDHMQARLSSAAGNSVRVSISRSPLITLMKREPEELPRLRLVKREPEADAEPKQ